VFDAPPPLALLCQLVAVGGNVVVVVGVDGCTLAVACYASPSETSRFP
jgi:hypothetical protein